MKKLWSVHYYLTMLKKIFYSAAALITLILLTITLLPTFVFYGRVLDQYGQPVVNAQVRYEGTHSFLSSGGGLSAVYTDNEGYFKIKTDGDSLVLAAIIHPEVEYNYPSKSKDRNGKETGIYAKTTQGFRNTGMDSRYLDARKYRNR